LVRTPEATATGDAVRQRLAALERFERWAKEHPTYPEPAAALSGVGLLYDLLPADARSRPIDTSGVAKLHRDLSVLEPLPR
jgi:hypothetical protein